jgi:KDO2-lipid IV(A) lauroyltransferase
MAAVAERLPATLARRQSRRRAHAGPRAADWLAYLALRGLIGVLKALPLMLALRIGEALAWIAYLLDVPHRRVGMRNLMIAFPDRPLRERRAILRGSFLNLGRMAAEIAHFPRLSAADLRGMVQFEDEAWWQEAIGWDRKAGVLILSGHFGNWELLAYAHGMRGYPVHMVHRAIANPLIDRWLHQLRARAGTNLIRKSRGASRVLKALRERGLLVMPIDQNSTRGLGVFVEFFGVLANTNAGIARIALRADAPVVPVFIVREGRSARHRIHVLPIMFAERTGDTERDVRDNTARFTAVFEDMVRRYPDHWLWMHKRWKTRPAGEPRFY